MFRPLRKSVTGLFVFLLLVTGVASARSLSTDAALALYTPQQLQNSFAACADQFPNTTPIDMARVSLASKPLALCSNHFAVLYSQVSKTPLIVFERLDADRLRKAKGKKRTNAFFADPRIPASGRGELIDYRKQRPAVDRGHLSPAANSPNRRAMAQSFALSNMVPQDPNSNRKAWRRIESDTRKYARRAAGSVFVFSGPLFDTGHTTVGKHHVWKPTRLFKLVYDESSGRAWAYILPNAASPVPRPVDYATFVQVTGFHLLDSVRVTGTISNQSRK